MKQKIMWYPLALAFVLASSIGSCKKDKFVGTVGICPEVKSTNPSNLDVGVPLNQIITVTFNTNMNPETINQTTFSLEAGLKIPGTLSYNPTTATLSFQPTTLLAPNTTYTGRVSSGVKDVTGNAMQAPYVWSFHTSPFPGTPFVNLRSAGAFGIIAGTGISNNAGISEIHDLNVGISPGVRSSITGFPPAIVVNGAIYASDDIIPANVAAMLNQAKQDLTDAYLYAKGATFPAAVTITADLGGTTLAPGIYKSASTVLIQSGNLTLDAQGEPNAIWIFQIDSDLTTVGGAGGSIILTGGAQAKNIFWQVGSSATIGDGTSFIGNVMALTSITMNSDATAKGRMLAINGAVVLTSKNIINKP